MSTKRILGISVFGVLVIVISIGLTLYLSYLERDIEPVRLPEAPVAERSPPAPQPDTLDRVEVTKENVQAVISTLSRPGIYSRNIKVESYWDGGYAWYTVSAAVRNDMTSLRIHPYSGIEKRIIVTPDRLYIWYRGDISPYIGDHSSNGDELRAADEWQMMITYEDILNAGPGDITDAGYTERDGAESIFAVYRSPLLGYIMTCYISIDLGLVTEAEEYDEAGELVYRMTTDGFVADYTDPAFFILPDGIDLGASNF